MPPTLSPVTPAYSVHCDSTHAPVHADGHSTDYECVNLYCTGRGPFPNVGDLNRPWAIVNKDDCTKGTFFMDNKPPNCICRATSFMKNKMISSGETQILKTGAHQGIGRHERKWTLILQISNILLCITFLAFFLQFRLQVEKCLDAGKREDELRSLSKRSVSLPTMIDQNLQGLESVQLVGAVPSGTLQVHTKGTIGPWRLENNSSKEWAQLSHNQTELKILQTGVYFINAQVLYLTREGLNSYEILRLGNNGEKEVLTVCANQAAAAGAAVKTTEVTCCTAVIARIMKNERLRLHQNEQGRIILFSKGYSHWGVIKIQGEGSLQLDVPR